MSRSITYIGSRSIISERVWLSTTKNVVRILSEQLNEYEYIGVWEKMNGYSIPPARWLSWLSSILGSRTGIGVSWLELTGTGLFAFGGEPGSGVASESLWGISTTSRTIRLSWSFLRERGLFCRVCGWEKSSIIFPGIGVVTPVVDDVDLNVKSSGSIVPDE